MSRETKLLLVILFAGAVLRAAALFQRDFWFDEAFAYHLAHLPIKDLLSAVLTDNNPPLYYLLLHYVIKLSSNEIVLRIPSVLASLATIPLIYILFKEQINKQVALVATTLFSVSPLAVYIGTEARLHSLATLFALGMTASFLALIKNQTLKTVGAFFAVSILGLYTHYYTALLFLPFTWILMRKKTVPKKPWLMILLVIGVVFAPWLVASSQTPHNLCACPNTLLSLPATLVAPAIGGVGEVTLRAFPQLPTLTIFLFVLTSVTLTFFFLRGLTKYPTIVGIFVVPLLTLSLFGIFLPVFSPKAFTVFSPLFFGIIGVGITSLRYYRTVTLLLAVALGIISLIQITNPFFAGTPLKPITAILEQDKNTPVAHTSTLTFYSLAYYSQGTQQHMLITPNSLSPQTVDFIGGQKQDIDPSINTVWLVDTSKWVSPLEYEDATGKIFANFAIEKSYETNSISIHYLRRK